MTNETYINDDTWINPDGHTSTENYCKRCKTVVDNVIGGIDNLVFCEHDEFHCSDCCEQMKIDICEDRLESYNDLD